MRADLLLRRNIDTLLKARGQTRTELAAWCGRSRSWLSKIFNESTVPEEQRGINLKYLDRIADFFGLSTYQLFQPGISPLTERRKGQDRRSGQDRRISARRGDLPVTPIRQLAVTPEDEALLAELHALDYETYQRVKGWITVARLGAGTRRRTAPHGEASLEAAPRSAGVRRKRGARPSRKPPKGPPTE